MKNLHLLAIFGFIIFPTSARDFRPEAQLENIPLPDSSIQQCYVFRTTAGVRYTVESSEDLKNWTAQEEIYGMGNDYVVTLREYTPSPPSPPGTPPTVAPVPAIHASIRLQRASGTEGGSVASWRSLDHDGPVVVRINGSMDAGWNQIPLFWDRFGAYSFFILHPNNTATPPSENPHLGTKDSAMLAVLEASLPEMNQQVIDSVARARNAPPPAPAAPGSRKYLRVFVDATVDTDSDGSPDWAEFEIASRGTGSMVSGVIGDPFNPDTNEDGISDGDQLDADLDGTSDKRDAVPSDSTAFFPLEAPPRYALFPITNVDPNDAGSEPYKISDKGRVLYREGTWCAGVWTPLVAPSGGSQGVPQLAHAYAINDNDVVLGSGIYQVSSAPETHVGMLYHWKTPSANPLPVKSSQMVEQGYAGRFIGDYVYHGFAPRPVLSNDGRFSAVTSEWSETARGMSSTGVQGDDGITRYKNELRLSIWTLPIGTGEIATEAAGAGNNDMPFHQAPGLSWGYRDDHNGIRRGKIFSPAALPDLPFEPYHVFATSNGILALPYPQLVDPITPKLFTNNTWQDCPSYKHAFDMADDGTAITGMDGAFHLGMTAPILLNGKWNDINRSTPGLPAPEPGAPVINLLDTTASGWILADRGVNDGELNSAVMLPIRAEGKYTRTAANPDGSFSTETEAAGVDDFSVGSFAPGVAVQDRIWIMAPKGGTGNVTFKAPLNSLTPLKIAAEHITFSGQAEATFASAEETFAIGVSATVTAGQDVLLDLTLGQGATAVASLSKPIGIKIMKDRVVKVNVYEVARRQSPGGPYAYVSHVPTEAEITEHLNDIFKPQINVTFDVKLIDPALALAWDANSNETLDSPGPGQYSPEQEAILAALPTTARAANIRVLLIGSKKNDGTVVLLNKTAYGIANRTGTTSHPGPTCWILGEYSGKQNGKEAQLDTIAHEVGHIFVDYGHPDQVASPGHAELPGTARNIPLRLMCSGTNSGTQSRLLVKGEWDEAEKWLRAEELAGRLGP